MVNVAAAFMLSSNKPNKEFWDQTCLPWYNGRKAYLWGKNTGILKDGRYSVEGRRILMLKEDKLYSKESN